MNTVEVSSTKSGDFRRFARATALLLTGAAVHLWLFPLPPGSGLRLLDRVTAGVKSVAKEGAAAPTGGDQGVVASSLGAVAPARNSTQPGRPSAGHSPRIRVTIEVVHPTVISPVIPAEPMRMSNAIFLVGQPHDFAPDQPLTPPNAPDEPAIRPSRLEIPPAATVVSPEFDLARRAVVPQPITALPQPPAHATQVPRHELPRRVDRPSDERLVSHVLQQYREAYESLDVSAAQNVWPTVDARALSAAFRQLAGQRVTFDSCGVSVSGSGAQATARCTGQAEYVPKVGSRRAYTATGEWVFDLQKENAAWRIIIANANIK